VLSQHNNDSLASLIAFQESLAAICAAETPLDEAVLDMLSVVMEIMGGQFGRIFLVDEDGRRSGSWSVNDIESDLFNFSDLLEAATYELEKIVQEDGESLRASIRLDPSAPEYWSALCVPFRQGDEIHGTMLILSTTLDNLNESQEDRLLLYAALIVQAIRLVDERARTAAAKEHIDLLLRESNDLAAMLVHDLQGPLGNIITGLEMAQTACDEEDLASARSMFETALHSSYQLRTLVASVLDISRLEMGQPLPPRKPVSARQLAEFALSLVEPAFGMRGVTPLLEIDPGLPAVLANEGMLQRVLLNLLDNALKASRSGQTIVVRAEHDSTRPYITFTVSDQGSGIPEEFHQQVFEKFQRVNADNTSKGLGLGLAFCRLAITAHGGDIWVEDNPGGGASFVFTLPVAAETAV
jgi:signal transduction histidine kinase